MDTRTPTGRFLCDEMLGDLARWLRAAGHDTLLARGGLPDAHWVAMARAQSRRLLTRDRRLLEETGGHGAVVLLPRLDLDRTALHLRDTLGVDWLHRPFSRCLVDNTPLSPAVDGDARRLPPDVPPARANRCDGCGRVYWPGSHWRRMHARMTQWATDRPLDRPPGTRDDDRDPARHSSGGNHLSDA